MDEIAERDNLIDYYAAAATQHLYAFKHLRTAMQAALDDLCDCGSISGCHDTRAREVLLSLLEGVQL